MRSITWTLAAVLTCGAFGAGCDSTNTQPADQSASAGGNGAFGEGTANPGEHSDQHFRNSVDQSGVSVPTTQP
jgi:opacity protein-like surface antigen